MMAEYTRQGASLLDPPRTRGWTPSASAAGETRPRITVIQHGDFAAAETLIAAGEPEPYFGMGRSVQAIHDLTRDRAHQIVSLDAPRYHLQRAEGVQIGLPLARTFKPVPASVALLLRARAIGALLDQFQPTHVLLRASGLLAMMLLRRCARRNIDTLVVMADFFSPRGPRQRWETRHLVALLNDPCVFLVGNHRLPATQSMIDCGVRADKAVAYDFAPSRNPADYPEKSFGTLRPWRLLYVGNMLAGKGVREVVEGTAILAQRGVPVTLTLAGDGPEMPSLRRLAEALPAGIVTFAGRISNDQAFELMREAALVCVPSRHSYPEGLPLTLTEALASRTPVVVSDHPVMTRAFEDGEGVRVFEAGNARALARVVESILADGEGYRRLSQTTAAAYARVECKTLMPELIARWSARF
jgi:glycosyltransferase involved in cell wall biosynthesis